MSEVSDYLAAVADPATRTALERVRDVAVAEVPEAVEGRSYGMPALRYRERPLIGFMAAKQHLSVFPFSPDVIAGLADRLDGFALSKGTIRFSVARPIPDDVLIEIVRRRVAEIDAKQTR